MKGNVNPFEPWRPAEANVPPPVRATQPWRPPCPPPQQTAVDEPPMVEPADPPRPRPKRSPQPQRPRSRPQAPATPSTPLRADQRVVVGMLFLLGVLGLIGLAWLGGTHFPRIAATLLAVAVGFTVGISVMRRRGWYTRLGWMAGGLAVAGLAAWFVPTMRGVSLWTAYRQMDELHALPPGEVAEFLRTAPDRRMIVEEFPTFAADVRTAEQNWLRRSVDEAIENADRQLETDPHQALADLQHLNDAVSPLEHFALVKKDLNAARQRALQACLKVALREVEDLLDHKEFNAVARRGAFWANELTVQAQALGEPSDLPQRLLPKRKEALEANLEAAREKVRALIFKDDHKAVAALGAKVSEEMTEEAKAVGLADEVDRFCVTCAAFGELARQAKKQ